jgi:hypothetical protein
MGYSSSSGRLTSIRFTAILALIGVTGLILWSSPPASAAPLVGRDGKIHACYKFKGKAKGTLRVVHSAKVRCPRQWKKVAWSATVPAGAPGAQGAPGPSGEPGAKGEIGLPGTAANVVVEDLEKQVNELLTKVQSLESVLAGVNNEQLTKAIGAVPVVETLCTQTKKLNEQSTALGTSMGALNTVLEPLLLGFSPVTVPTALPAFTCPAF